MKNFMLDHVCEIVGVVIAFMVVGDIAIFKRLDDMEHCRK